MRIPEHLLAPTVDGKQFLTAFTAELRQTGTSRLRAQKPTYALVEFDSPRSRRSAHLQGHRPAAPVQGRGCRAFVPPTDPSPLWTGSIQPAGWC